MPSSAVCFNSTTATLPSADAGTRDVSCSAHDELVTVVWAEKGGPKVKLQSGTGNYPPRRGSVSVEHLRQASDAAYAFGSCLFPQ